MEIAKLDVDYIPVARENRGFRPLRFTRSELTLVRSLRSSGKQSHKAEGGPPPGGSPACLTFLFFVAVPLATILFNSVLQRSSFNAILST